MSRSPSAGGDRAGSWNDSAQQDSDDPGLRRLLGDQVGWQGKHARAHMEYESCAGTAGNGGSFLSALPGFLTMCSVLQVERTRSAAPAWAPHGSGHSPAASNDSAALGSGGLPDQRQHQRGNSLGAAAQRSEAASNRRWKLPTIKRAGDDLVASQPRCIPVQQPSPCAS